MTQQEHKKAGPDMALTQDETAELEKLVADVDRGGRSVAGAAGMGLFLAAMGWSLSPLWYASPLPFALNLGIFIDPGARALHLGIAMFLAYLAFPARKQSARDRIPIHDWLLALIAAFCGSYLFFFYKELATRPGIPTTMDVVVASMGLVLLLEATRRSLGAP